MTTHTAILRPAFNLRQALSTILRSAAENWERHRTFAQTKRELGTLSDRELEDIGISRWMISDIARETAYGPKV